MIRQENFSDTCSKPNGSPHPPLEFKFRILPLAIARARCGATHFFQVTKRTINARFESLITISKHGRPTDPNLFVANGRKHSGKDQSVGVIASQWAFDKKQRCAKRKKYFVLTIPRLAWRFEYMYAHDFENKCIICCCICREVSNYQKRLSLNFAAPSCDFSATDMVRVVHECFLSDICSFVSIRCAVSEFLSRPIRRASQRRSDSMT